MPAKRSKIVLLKEDVDPQSFAEASVRSAKVVDALSVMSTDFTPEPDTVQANPDCGFFVANLSSSEAKKLSEQPEVEAIEDDIKVYALDEGTGPIDNLGPESLELDPEDIEALEADPYPELEEDELPMTLEDLRLLSQIEPDVTDDLAVEQMLLGGPDPLISEGSELAGVSKEKLIPFLRSFLKEYLSKSSDTSEVCDEKISAVIRETGLGKILDADESVVAAGDYIPVNLRQILAPSAWHYTRGDSSRVAVVDTGIYSRHPDLRVWGGASYVPGVSSPIDDNGHGTHVAGIIAALLNGNGLVGVAPRARLYAVKVLNQSGSGYLSWILNGLAWCLRHRMHIVNLSLGSAVSTHSTGVYSRAYERMGIYLRRQGILAVAAAGNGFKKPVANPARCHSYMAVSAIDSRYRTATFSNWGPQVEICAPGVRIWSTYPPTTYRQLSGTSMSTPHVAAVAALVKSRHPSWHGDRIRVHLWRTARDLGTPGRDWVFGFGMVNAMRAVL